nr:hypothetical protein [Carnobacterium maltaromaticum]
MAYTPTEWKEDDTITDVLLNKLEAGVKSVEDSIPAIPGLAAANKDGLLAKADYSKLAKITGGTVLTVLAEDAELPAVVTKVNEIITILKASGISK